MLVVLEGIKTLLASCNVYMCFFFLFVLLPVIFGNAFENAQQQLHKCGGIGNPKSRLIQINPMTTGNPRSPALAAHKQLFVLPLAMGLVQTERFLCVSTPSSTSHPKKCLDVLDRLLCVAHFLVENSTWFHSCPSALEQVPPIINTSCTRQTVILHENAAMLPVNMCKITSICRKQGKQLVHELFSKKEK